MLNKLSFFIFIFHNALASPTDLPRCVRSPTTLKNIQDILNVNKSNDRKYNGYRVELQNEDDLQLATRLIYSEVLAANCPEHQTILVDKITSVITNRILARKNDIKSVVFQRDQFASSLHIYKNSRHRDFLCPKDGELWKLASNKISLFLKEKKTSLPPDVINYFLYKHDPRWTKEPWKLKENIQNTNEDVRNCLRVFHVPEWK